MASIGDSFLLGADILDAHDIMVSSRRGLSVNGKWVPCAVTRRPVHTRRAVVAMPHDVEIPAGHETIPPSDGFPQARSFRHQENENKSDDSH